MAATRGTMTANFRVQRKGSAFVFLIILLYEIVFISGNAVHLTMVTPTPYGAGMSQVRLSCFRSSPDTNIDLSFGRPFQIGIPGSSIRTDTTLPSGAFSSTSTTPSAVTQNLPMSFDSTGLFYCEGSSSGMTTRVYSIIHSNTRRFEPVDGLVTKTVNRGEHVTLSVSSFNGLGTAPFWHRIRDGIVDDLNSVPGQNTDTITVPSLDVMDGDLYAVIQSSVSVSDNHFGMIRLVVRGCSAGLWGPPDCTSVCNQCYNGGVCDDETGQCICAPGFSGPNCLTVPGAGVVIVNDCPVQGVTATAPTGTTSMVVGWTEPTATDEFGQQIAYSSRSRSPGQVIFVGQTVQVMYTFTAMSGLFNTCTFIVTVNLTVNIVGCPTQTVTAVELTDTQVTWTEPTATDASGQQITNIIRSHRPGDVFNIGQTTEVTYTFTADSGHQATCTFYVVVNRAVNIINCPSQTVTVIDTTGATSKPVTWAEPAATNSLNQLISNVIKSHQPGDSFNVGETTAVTYTFTDDISSLYDTCTFFVTVNGAVNIIGCQDSLTLIAVPGSTTTLVTWTEPTATDASGLPITNIMKTHAPGTSFSVGQTQVIYTFTDNSGDTDTCTFNVIVHGILEFQTLTKTNPGQDVKFSCAATSGDTLSADSLYLVVSGTPGSTVFYTNTSSEQNTLNNTFIVPGLQENQQILCVLTHMGQTWSAFNAVSFFVLPSLSQQPMLTPGSTLVEVTWNAWNSSLMDSGDGPILSYKVYYSPASSSSWTNAGTVSVTDQSKDTYYNVVQPLDANTSYKFSVAAIREGQGGQGPMSPESLIQTLPLPPVTQAPRTSTPLSPVTQELQTSMATTNEDPSVGLSTFIVIICVIVVVVILVMGCLVYFLRVRKTRHQHSKPQESARDQEMTGYENEITPDGNINASATDYEPVGQNQASTYEPVGDVRSSTTYEDVGLPTWAKPWSVPWGNVMVGTKVLGKGQFGEVRYGGVMIEGELCKAAIKKLHDHASLADRQNFLDEFRSMTKIRRHPNIVTILGACQHEGELYVAMEYLPNGDLRSYLRNARSMDGEESLSSELLLQFALDVAKGMRHLATSGVIHRDLAARNILLDENVVAKISDFGLSRGEDIYVQLSKTRVPTRWLSLESLTNQTYTTKSDVWSYGILLWEIATVGGTPYSGIKTGVLTSKLQTGYRMPKPTNCDKKIYDLMLKCWQEKPSERPSFKKIVSVLTTMAENQDDQIYMSLLPRSEEHKYVNIRPEFDDN